MDVLIATCATLAVTSFTNVVILAFSVCILHSLGTFLLIACISLSLNALTEKCLFSAISNCLSSSYSAGIKELACSTREPQTHLSFSYASRNVDSKKVLTQPLLAHSQSEGLRFCNSKDRDNLKLSLSLLSIVWRRYAFCTAYAGERHCKSRSSLNILYKTFCKDTEHFLFSHAFPEKSRYKLIFTPPMNVARGIGKPALISYFCARRLSPFTQRPMTFVNWQLTVA